MRRKSKRDKRYSVIQPELDRCYVCGAMGEGLHKHEVFEGTANRAKSIKWGMVIALCPAHHNMSNDGIHFNKDLEKRVKREAQIIFERTYPDEDFLRIFGKNYL